MFDTNIFDRVAELDGLIERLRSLGETEAIEILTTHIQRDELAAIPDAKKREAVAGIPTTMIPTSGAVWGASRWDEATWGDGAGDVLLNDVKTPSGSHVHDALIATTAAASCDILVTHDERLRGRIAAVGSKLSVLDFADFLRLIESIDHAAGN